MKLDNRAMSVALLLTSLFAIRSSAQDWPQWRGPDRTGVMTKGPRLIDTIPEKGLAVLWQSEAIPDRGHPGEQGSDLGYSTPVAAGGRVFLYLNQRVKDDSPLRLTWGVLNRLGCFKTALPEELAKKVEAARNSPQRAALSSDQTPAWASDWVVQNLSHSEYITFGAGIEERLIRGAAVLDLAMLNKLAALMDKPYRKQDELQTALVETGLDGDQISSLLYELGANRKRAFDVLFCFDAKTGKTLWKKRYPGVLFEYGTSSTPCIDGERIYVSGGKTVYCFNIADGTEIWRAPCPAKEVSSSPVVADGVLVIQAGALCGIDTKDGKLRWTRPEFRGVHASPTIWRKDGKAYAVQNCGLVDLQTGNLMWFLNNGADPSPVISGDLLVAAVNGNTFCYRLASDKPEQLWKLNNYGMQPSTPMVFEGHLYATKSQSGPLYCVELTSGQIKWTSPEKENYSAGAFNTACGIIADGKIFLDGYPNQLFMVRAAPGQFELLGKSKLTPSAFRASSPTIADGRLFIRGRDALVCYDLRAK